MTTSIGGTLPTSIGGVGLTTQLFFSLVSGAHNGIVEGGPFKGSFLGGSC